MSANAHAPDLAVIGGGIVGCAVAAFAAEAGARVRLYERERIASGASGRNAGLVQHPLDHELVALFGETLELYRGLGHGFRLPAEPTGVLVLDEDAAVLEPTRRALRDEFPELGAQALAGAELRDAEPGLAEGLAGYRMDTGYTVPPAAATTAFAARARASGAELLEGVAAAPDLAGGRAGGVRARGRTEPAGAVVLAAGPWTSALADPSGAWRPIAAAWGVSVELRLGRPPRHALEEAGVEALLSGEQTPPALFSLVTHGGASAVGSTFLAAEPDPAALAPALIERGARFLPAIAGTPAASLRACARLASADGRPLLGPGAADGLFLAAGHGPWGISLGPASARLVAAVALGAPADAIPAALQPRRSSV